MCHLIYSAEKKEQYGLLRVESLIEAWLLIELVKVQRIEREQMGEGNFLASHIHYLDIPLSKKKKLLRYTSKAGIALHSRRILLSYDFIIVLFNSKGMFFINILI